MEGGVEKEIDRSTSDATFEITELLEHILSQLDMRALLLVQRLSRTWRDVIASSRKLQRHLFMEPAELVDMMQLASEYKQTPLPFIDKAELVGVEKKPRLVASEALDLSQTTMLNPLLDIMNVNPFENGEAHACFDPKPFDDGHGVVQPSWKCIYFAQPPPREVFAEVFVNYGVNRTGVHRAIYMYEGYHVRPINHGMSDDEPMRAGELMDSVEKDVLKSYGCDVGWERSWITFKGFFKTIDAVEQAFAAPARDESGEATAKDERSL